jgi:hypothetical protein
MGQLPDTLSADDCGLPKSNRSFVANPTTDLSYEEYESAAVGVMAQSHTAFRAHVLVDADASGGETITTHDAVWGGTVGVKPTLARTGAGVYTITWTASYDDLNPTPARVVSHATNIRFAQATIAENAAGMIACTWTANVLTVRTWNAAGAATDIDFTASVS